jgi:asparagine synthase (glutamine-hydrolysing)
METCNWIESTGTPGVFIEAGCALGGSTIFIASCKTKERPFFVYDVFEMIPPPTEEDTESVHERYQEIVDGKSEGINGDKYYGYEENLLQIVKDNLRRYGIDTVEQNVNLIKGLLQDTLKITQPVAFAHIDVDWYQPVKTCLERIFPALSPGGSIVLDDYHDWGGCKKATDEYLEKVAGQFSLDDSSGSMKITKKTKPDQSNI